MIEESTSDAWWNLQYISTGGSEYGPVGCGSAWVVEILTATVGEQISGTCFQYRDSSKLGRAGF